MNRNLRLAFPDLNDDELQYLLRQTWGNVGAVLGEYPHFDAMCFKDFDKHFEVIEKSNLDDYRAGKKAGIFVAAHIGNWEVSVISALRLGTPLTVVYSPLKNPHLNKLVLKRRARLRCNLVSRAEGARTLVRELSQGRSLGLVIDARDDDGEPISFFGMDKMSTVFPARLALRANCDLIPTRVERLGDARFRITLHDPISPNPELKSDKDQAVYMIGEVNRMFEQWIRERPHEWLCNKRAWSKKMTPRPSRPQHGCPPVRLGDGVQAE